MYILQIELCKNNAKIAKFGGIFVVKSHDAVAFMIMNEWSL